MFWAQSSLKEPGNGSHTPGANVGGGPPGALPSSPHGAASAGSPRDFDFRGGLSALEYFIAHALDSVYVTHQTQSALGTITSIPIPSQTHRDASHPFRNHLHRARPQLRPHSGRPFGDSPIVSVSAGPHMTRLDLPDPTRKQ